MGNNEKNLHASFIISEIVTSVYQLCQFISKYRAYDRGGKAVETKRADYWEDVVELRNENGKLG